MTDNIDGVVFPPEEPALPEELTGEEGVAEAGPLADVDPAKLAMLRERLAAFKKNEGKTISGSEDPDAAPESLDLTKFEVDPELEHLYKRATAEDSPDGTRHWFVIEHQYMIQTGAWHIDGSGQATGKNKQGVTLYRAKGLDHIITDIINGPEGILSRQKGWRLSALLPNQMSNGVAVFERQVKRALPDPKPIVKPEEQPMEKTTDEELARMNDRAKEWAAGQEPTEAEVEGAREVADTPEETNAEN